MLRRFFLSHHLRKILFHCDLSGAARNFLRAAPFISQPRRLWFGFCFSCRLSFGSRFFFASLKFLAYGGRQKFFCLPPLPYENSAAGSPRKFYARTASRFCVAEKPFFCKLYSRSPAFCTAAVLSRPNVGRSKKFCSVRHFYLHIKAAARYPRGCRFFTSFYAPLSGNNIHIHHAP